MDAWSCHFSVAKEYEISKAQKEILEGRLALLGRLPVSFTPSGLGFLPVFPFTFSLHCAFLPNFTPVRC